MTEPVDQHPAEPSPDRPTAPAATLAAPAATLAVPAAPDVAQASTADGWKRFDRWSSTFFLSLAVVTFVAALFVLTAAQEAGTDVLAWLIAVTIATVALLLVAAFSLDRGAPWGRVAAVGLLVATIATDAVRVLVDLTRSSITIPLAALVALYLLSIRPGPLARLGGRDRRIALAIVGLFLVVNLVAIASTFVGPGPAASVP